MDEEYHPQYPPNPKSMNMFAFTDLLFDSLTRILNGSSVEIVFAVSQFYRKKDEDDEQEIFRSAIAQSRNDVDVS